MIATRTLLVAIGGAVAVSEVLNFRAADSGSIPDGHPCAVVVLGYPSKSSGRAHPIQRSRVEAGIRALREHDADVMVMCGGAVKNSIVEAETMVELARELGVVAAMLVAEGTSRTTWENVQNAMPLVADCKVVLIVSDPMHAARALRYWCRQNPGDADRVFVATSHRLLEQFWLTTPSAAYELAISAQDRLRSGIASPRSV